MSDTSEYSSTIQNKRYWVRKTDSGGWFPMGFILLLLLLAAFLLGATFIASAIQSDVEGVWLSS